ncbi:hypothetical protein D8O27_17500 [Burkholderia mallei]|nr:hypothetical protein BOC43_10010 [Burkholderia pseudomallei]KOT01420.1 hypothetical protein DM50_3042 [Burkholderia mallei]PNW94754.1 hypothetical protein CF649_33000 [Burkholderia sp. 136(2017)]PNX15158.1 hypothetical protein CF650_11050 [Burkholderia sp. 129]PNX25313.1 hypothetical protein CF647_31490 [Burkholderia sp. 117]PNX31563.1 hypothetical protein CF648_33005 [Burkholderia sp. 137]
MRRLFAVLRFCGFIVSFPRGYRAASSLSCRHPATARFAPLLRSAIHARRPRRDHATWHAPLTYPRATCARPS